MQLLLFRHILLGQRWRYIYNTLCEKGIEALPPISTEDGVSQVGVDVLIASSCWELQINILKKAQVTNLRFKLSLSCYSFEFELYWSAGFLATCWSHCKLIYSSVHVLNCYLKTLTVSAVATTVIGLRLCDYETRLVRVIPFPTIRMMKFYQIGTRNHFARAQFNVNGFMNFSYVVLIVMKSDVLRIPLKIYSYAFSSKFIMHRPCG